MKKTKIKCHGHKCPDKGTCKWYVAEKVKEDDNIGDNQIKCEYYEKK